jgi:hypothetical protein
MDNSPEPVAGLGLEDSGKMHWVPVIGTATTSFIQRTVANGFSETAAASVIGEAREILGNCVDPQSTPKQTALLAVGRVQSGKTLSFTTVTSLARDNGYGVVVLLTGTTGNLKTQSENRLRRDLQLGVLQSHTTWTHLSNPSVANKAALDQAVSAWRAHKQGQKAKKQPTLIITVLKHHKRLSALADVMSLINLSDIPVLVIDDEADQATLNTKAASNLRKGLSDESGTYASIANLRDALPFHSFLQYTATPQANLLMAIADRLNPNYAKVLTTGDAYTGGEFFFAEKTDLLREIPEDEEEFDDTEVPESLQEAVRSFLLVCAVAEAEDALVNRSMLIQASQYRERHDVYADWVQGLLLSWRDLISDHESTTEASFEATWRDLKKTWQEIPPFDHLWSHLADVCGDVRLVVVNSEGEEVDWGAKRFWILVGGQKLDRGFTVEGLVTTYMPRPKALTPDTLQQRARFFGYRRGYAAGIRVFLQPDVRAAYSEYVKDEGVLHRALREHNGQPLSEWRRSFLLSGGMKQLVRSNVIGRTTVNLDFKEGWVQQRRIPEKSNQVGANLGRAEAYMSSLQSEGALRDVRTFLSAAHFKDVRENRPVTLVAADRDPDEIVRYLLSLDVNGSDQVTVTAVCAWLSSLAQSQGIDVVFIDSLSSTGQSGRTVTGLSTNIFTGRSPAKVAGDDLAKLNYTGDRSVHTSNPTLHVRAFKVTDAGFEGSVADRLPWFAVWVPTEHRKNVVLEVLP